MTQIVEQQNTIQAALLDMAGANLTTELNDAILDQNAERDMNALRDKAKRLAKTVLGTDPYMKK